MNPSILMPLVIACGLLVLAGAGAIAWVVIHLWVAMRMGASLARRDYITLGLGFLGVAIGLGGLTLVAGTRPPAANGPQAPNDPDSTAPTPSTP
ncbi:MAG: hypothetical protein ACOYPS_05170 [Phycisphaerales bacterium]|jgi:hypothetical protein